LKDRNEFCHLLTLYSSMAEFTSAKYLYIIKYLAMFFNCNSLEIVVIIRVISLDVGIVK